MSKPNLVNAIQYSELYPDFEVLPHAERVSLQAGDVAKVCAQFEGHPEYEGERFWILIKTSNEGMYTGTVDNNLEYTAFHGIKCGDLIAFDYRNIYDTWRNPHRNADSA